MAFQDATPEAEAPFADAVEVLNYALTLEHLENAFYRDGLDQFDAAAFEELGYTADVRDFIVEIGKHEQEHVDFLAAVIEDLEGEPVVEAEYDFGYTDLATFLATAATLEGVGVAAYQGAAQYAAADDTLLTAALTIHGVEARHASYLNVLTGQAPFPDSFNPTLTPAEVLELATPFIVGDTATDDEDSSTPEA